MLARFNDYSHGPANRSQQPRIVRLPLALSGIGFGTYIALLSVPMFLIAIIVASVSDFEGNQRTLEELADAA